MMSKLDKDEALLEYTEKFDGVKLTSDELLVTKEEIEEAYTLKLMKQLIGDNPPSSKVNI